MREGVQRFFSSLVSVPSGVEFWIILRIFNKNRKNSDYIPEFCNFPLKIQIVKFLENYPVKECVVIIPENCLDWLT